MNLEFYLHNSTDRKGQSAIFARYSHAGKKWRFSTGIKTDPRHWNGKKNTVKDTHPQAAYIRIHLDQLRKRVMDCAFSCVAKELPPDVLRVKNCFSRKPETGGIRETWDRFQKERMPQLAAQTQKNYRQSFEVLRTYLDSVGQDSFAVFDAQFYDQFLAFLLQRGNLQNTAISRIRFVKALLKYARKTGIITHDGGRDWEIRTQKYTDESVYLTHEELDRLAAHSCPNEQWEKIRDVFLFHCHTGLRYSEGQELKPEWVEEGVLYFPIPKTGKRGMIQLTPLALQIFEKYNGDFRISIRKANRQLKVLCKEIGMTGKVLDKRGKSVERCSLVSTHTARRTFITLLLQAGVDIQTVRRLVGHSRIDITAQYDKRGAADLQYHVKAVFG